MESFELLRPIAHLSIVGEFGIEILEVGEEFVTWYFTGTDKGEPIRKSSIKYEENEEGLNPYFTNEAIGCIGTYYLNKFEQY